jgi:putative thioredoxin
MNNVRDIDQQEFESAVVRRSREIPVIVDFWAEWCGPCKTLGPALERLVGEHEGSIELAKVDVDANEQLSAQFGIRSIPTVIAFKDGQPVNSFLGAQDEVFLRQWIEQLLPTEQDRMVDEARDLALDGDEAAAEEVYRRVLAEVPDHHEAATGLAALLIARKETEEALIILGKLPKTAEVERLEAAARVTAATDIDLSDLERRLSTDPEDDEARLELGQALAAKGEHEPALDNLLAVVRSGGPLRETARQAMVDVFGILGPDHPLTATYRKALANSLF